MLKLENRGDLQRLIDDGVAESLTLEYKASGSLGIESKQRDELCKDVTAFANSAGGQIIYGIVDDKNLPVKIDNGADPKITKEWVEQVIDSRVQPRIEGLVITSIQLDNGFGFVITIPQATSRAPHQAPDKKYYKRQNFQSSPMEDYEIRDTLRRATTPLLTVRLSFGANRTAQLEFAHQQEFSKPVNLTAWVANQSPQPAYHALIYLGLDVELSASAQHRFEPSGAPIGHDNLSKMNWFVGKVPPDLPLFQEGPPLRLEVLFGVAGKFLRSSVFNVFTVVQTPGYASTDHWAIACNSGLLKLYGPNDPQWAPGK